MFDRAEYACTVVWKFMVNVTIHQINFHDGVRYHIETSPLEILVQWEIFECLRERVKSSFFQWSITALKETVGVYWKGS